MNLLAQRVLSSSLYIEKKKILSIDRGILALVGFEKGDTSSDCELIADKLLNYRIFPDDKGRMENSVLDIKGDLLLVPEVTLALQQGKDQGLVFLKQQVLILAKSSLMNYPEK